MRICHIWPNFFPVALGGVERDILNFSNFLSEKTNNRFLLLTDKCTIPFPTRYQLPKRQQIKSLEVYRLGPNYASLLRNTSYKLCGPKSARFNNLLRLSLYKEAKSIRNLENVDVFHLHGIWRTLYPHLALRLSQHFQRPLVISLHGASIDPKEPFSMPIRDPDMIDVMKHASAITTFSEDILRALCQLGFGKKSHMVRNFIDVKAFNHSQTTSTSRMQAVMVSRLDEFKDPFTTIRAFACIKKKLPTATLNVLGNGPLYEQTMALIKDLNLESAVNLVGITTNVRNFLWNSDVFFGTRDSYMATLEAWAAGLPVLAPNIGIMKEIVSNGENGLLVKHGDSEAWADSAITLFQNKILQRKLVLNGLEAVKKHDIHTIANQVNNIYASLNS
jgi:glycosyltransferase involved in cell wall biosynthesis